MSVDYSRPAMRGRTMFGDLVPFGKLWRTGANMRTKFTTDSDLKIEGKELKLNSANCTGCGACTAMCHSGAVNVPGFSNQQIEAQIDSF